MATNKKHYYIIRSDFSNVYSLCWVVAGSQDEQDAVADGWERISRKDAIAKCIEERANRKFDPAFSGYGDTIICNYRVSEWEQENCHCRMSTKDGYIYE